MFRPRVTDMSRTVIMVCLIAFGGVVSCKDRAACERSRLELAKKWEELKNTAGAYKTTKEDEDLTPAKKEERLKVWGAVEDKAGLVQSSFATKQVTWPAADTARQDINQKLQAVAATGDQRVESFSLLLRAAGAQYEQYKQKCR
jgi:hypothetical protein